MAKFFIAGKFPGSDFPGFSSLKVGLKVENYQLDILFGKISSGFYQLIVASGECAPSWFGAVPQWLVVMVNGATPDFLPRKMDKKYPSLTEWD